MSKWRVARGGLLIAALAYGWIAAASALFCVLAGDWPYYIFPFVQWLYAAPYYLANWYMTVCVILSAVLPTIAVGVIATLILQARSRRRLLAPADASRPIERGATDNHGHSAWRSMEDTQRLFPGPHRKHGGLVVGEAYRVDQDPGARMAFNPRDEKTWGKGGTMPLLIDPCADGGFSLEFAGTRALKSTSAVTKILHWTGSKVILDPSTELGPMLNGALVREGQHVAHIGIHGDGFNVLDWIDTTDKEAEVHVKTAVSWIYDEDKGGTSHDDAFFTPMGRNLVTCLLADVMWSDTVEHTLAALAEGVAVPADQMLTLLRGIHATSHSRMARMLAGTLLEEAADETIGSIRLNAVNGVSWLFTEAYADLVSSGDFNPADLCNGKTTVFLNISLRTLETTPAIARVLVGALLNTLYRAEGQSGRVLFLMDEAARLGKLQALETARDTGAKYGVVLHLLYQSLGQLEEAWGRSGMRAWIDGAAWLAFASIRAGGAGRDVAEWLGTHGVMAYSEGDNRGSQRPWGIALGSRSKGTTSSTHEISRKLIQAAELQQDLRADELIVIPSVGKPIRCGRAPYFRRRELMHMVTANRFAA